MQMVEWIIGGFLIGVGVFCVCQAVIVGIAYLRGGPHRPEGGR